MLRIDHTVALLMQVVHDKNSKVERKVSCQMKGSIFMNAFGISSNKLNPPFYPYFTFHQHLAPVHVKSKRSPID